MTQKKKNKKIPNKIPKLLPKVEKELKDFMVDEQGKMTRKDVAKLGVSLAVLGMMMQPESAAGHSNSTTHSNVIQTEPPKPGPPNCVTHTNITTHANHGNHSDGGWMC